ncbi:hypothetical protein GQX73_g4633 [Xylaria multiplex]|uniref:Large ribosomal subunit protein mL54 n=1 Tax=Xylaria multiplex TaxID=323545 RepID=A0A7C8IXS7_9PEZI|nr:hypothetical protein GQX73_g4633 [Xylaria multiplex]
MPTPESAAFLAKKPTVPPTFEGVDYDDNKRLKQAQDAVVREQWVQVMMGRLVREELSKCYYREGVNHLEKCGPLRAEVSVRSPSHWSRTKTSANPPPKLRPPGTKFLELQQPGPNSPIPLPSIGAPEHLITHPIDSILQSAIKELSPGTIQFTMICRRCLQRASALRTRVPSTTTPISWSLPIRSRPTATRQYAAAAAATATTSTPSPPLSTPLADGEAPAAESLSSCAEGTILTGLNYFKNKTDPVALADNAYPEWLWKCLDVQKKKAEEGEADDAGDEFSKSKKQRKIAAKRQRALEARLLAEGNLEALAPKIPLQHQTINLPANEAGTTEGSLEAAAAREDLRRAMRRERKAKIKESNYLKSM